MRHKGVTFLQETHSTKEDKQLWQKDFGCDIFMSHGSRASKGVAILLNVDYKLIETYEDKDGRLLLVQIEYLGEILTLVNVYFPTKDKATEQLKLINSLTKILAKYEDTSIILGGDFNLALDPDLDKQGGASVHEESKKVRLNLNTMLENLSLVDTFRLRNPDKKLNTWRSLAKKVSTRLDYIFVTDNLDNRIKSCKKYAAKYTDHDLVEYIINLRNIKDSKGKGLWKFNCNLSDPIRSRICE